MRGAIPILGVLFLVETELIALGPLASILLIPLTVLVAYKIATHALIQRAVVQGLERPGDAIFAAVHRCALALAIHVIKENSLHLGQLTGRNEGWFQNNSPLNCLLKENWGVKKKRHLK